MRPRSGSISIIVPVYNASKYLDQCIASLLEQTVEPLEVILVDDCSTDDSVDVMRRWATAADGLVRVVELAENGASGAARNRGIDLASGEFVAFVDPDDWVSPLMCERLLEVAHRDAADVVISGHACVDERSGATQVRRPCYECCGRPSKSTTSARLGCVAVSPWAKLFRRALFVDYGLRFPEKVYRAQDRAVIPFVLAKAETISAVDDVLYYYRVQGNSITNRRNDARVLDSFVAADIYLSNAKRLGFYGNHSSAIDSRYVRSVYGQGLAILAQYFDDIDYARMGELRSRMRDEYSGFRRNPHYRQWPLWERTLTRLNDVSPRLAGVGGRLYSSSVRLGLRPLVWWIRTVASNLGRRSCAQAEIAGVAVSAPNMGRSPGGDGRAGPFDPT